MALTKISTDGVKDDAVTAGKIPANAVGSSELASNAVARANIQDAEVIESKIAANAVTNAKIAAGVVNTSELTDNAVTHAKYQDIPTSRLLGRTSSGTGSPETLDASTVRTFLNVADGATASSGTTINNNADDRVITGSGTANTLEGEANLTFDGTVLQTQATAPDLRIKSTNAGLGQSDEVGRISIHTSDPTTPTGVGEVFRIKSFSANANGADYSTELTNRAGSGGGESAIRLGQGAVGAIAFRTNTSGDATERMRIASNGKVGIGTASPDDTLDVVGTAQITGNTYIGGDIHMYTNSYSGKGILLGGSGDSNRLDDYEEGTWTPGLDGNSYGGNSYGYTARHGNYVKTGKHVVASFYLTWNNFNGSGHIMITGLPFTVINSNTIQHAGPIMTDGLNWPSGSTSIVTHNWYGISYFRLYTSQDNGGWQAVQCDGNAGILGTLNYIAA